jgi:predicted O-methyltransferase YrrM
LTSILFALLQIELHECKADDLISDLKRRKEAIADETEEASMLFDLVFIDADKKAYMKYLLALLGGGIEASHASLAEYVEVRKYDYSDSLLSDGAVVIVDNTLWKGLVLMMVIYLNFAFILQR